MTSKIYLHRLEHDKAMLDKVIRASLLEIKHDRYLGFPVLAPQEAAALLRMVQEEQSRQYVVLSRHE